MARRAGLPKGTLDTLIDEARDAAATAAAAAVEHDELPVRVRPRKARKVVPPYTTTPRASRRRVEAAPSRRPAIEWEVDPVSRYAASRGLPRADGAIPALRLAMQLAMDVREAARKERTSMVGVVSRALAGYLVALDRL